MSSTESAMAVSFVLLCVCLLLSVCCSSEGMLLGGQTPISPRDLKSTEVLSAASFAVEKLNEYSDGNGLLVLVGVVKGTSQVVAGMRYRLVLQVGRSSVCKREPDLYSIAITTLQCPVDQDSVHEVFTDVWRKPSNLPTYVLNDIKLYTEP